jgi:hypothetical protein
MVTKQEIMDLVNRRVTHMLLVAESSLPPSQFQAFRKLMLDAFGKNGLVGELERLCWSVAAEER